MNRALDEAERAMALAAGKFLRCLRESKGLSLRAVADRARMHPATVAAIEFGDTPVPITRALKLCAVYGSSLVELAVYLDQSFRYEQPARFRERTRAAANTARRYERDVASGKCVRCSRQAATARVHCSGCSATLAERRAKKNADAGIVRARVYRCAVCGSGSHNRARCRAAQQHSARPGVADSADPSSPTTTPHAPGRVEAVCEVAT